MILSKNTFVKLATIVINQIELVLDYIYGESDVFLKDDKFLHYANDDKAFIDEMYDIMRQVFCI